jgi:hypothetical protein
VLANLMFALPAVSISAKDRASAAHFLSEIIAAQLVGGALAVVVIRALYPAITPAQAADVLIPHPPSRASRERGPGAGLPSSERPLS